MNAPCKIPKAQVLLSTYTKNQAMKKMPIPRSNIVRCGKIAGLIGLT